MSRRMALIHAILRSKGYNQQTIDLIVHNIRSSSIRVYDNQWDNFHKWYYPQGLSVQSMSYTDVTNYLAFLFHEKGLMPATVRVHRAAIASVFNLYRNPDPTGEEALSRLITAMFLQRPRPIKITPSWHLGVVVSYLLSDKFVFNLSDRHLSLELLTRKTVFLVAMASAARASELCAMSRVPGFITFTEKQGGQGTEASIRPFAGFFPKNATPENIPPPVLIPGISHLYGHRELDRLLCPVRAIKLYLSRSEERAKSLNAQRLFIHWEKDTNLKSSHLSKWLVELIQEAHQEASPEVLQLQGVSGHQVRSLASSWAYFKDVPLSQIRDSVGWRSRDVFTAHYLKDVSSDESNWPANVVLAGQIIHSTPPP